MKIIPFILAVVSICYGCNSKTESPSSIKETPAVKKDLSSTDIQIKLALLAVPLEKRDSCTVYGYSADTQLVLLRKGTNELICVADDPKVYLTFLWRVMSANWNPLCNEDVNFDNRALKISSYLISGKKK